MASTKAIAAIALTLIIAAPIGLGYLFASENVEHTDWVTTNTANVTETLYNNEIPIYSEYTGASNNSKFVPPDTPVWVQTGTVPTAYPLWESVTRNVEFTANVYVDMPSGEWFASIPAGVQYSVMIPREGGGWDVYGGISTSVDIPITYTGGKMSLNTTATIAVSAYEFSTTNFADVSYGWKLPDSSVKWTNNQANQSVTFLIDFKDNSTITFNAGDVDNITSLTKTSGVITVTAVQTSETKTLGSYDYILATIELTTDGRQIFSASGLTAWPSFSSAYPSFNKISVETSTNYQDVQTVRIGTTDLDNVFRCERALIKTGTFPASLDATLDMGNLFPDRSYSVKLNSIGVYGDSITLDGTTYAVSDGQVTIGGHNVPLRAAVITSHWNGADYDNAINGYSVGSTASPMSITFDGTWSLTATANILDQTTNTQAEWVPGVFAFDKDSFVGVIVLAAALTFIGVGMYGARSGLKAGLLLMICGGAALIAITTL